MIQLGFAALGQGYLHHFRRCRLLAAHDSHAMVEGGDVGGVHSEEPAPLGENLWVRQLFHFQFVTAARGLESGTEGGRREGGRGERGGGGEGGEGERGEREEGEGDRWGA